MNVDQRPPYLTWDKYSLRTARAPQIGNHQYYQDANNDGNITQAEKDNPVWGYKACGQIALASVMNALFGVNLTEVIMDAVNAKASLTNQNTLAKAFVQLIYDGIPIDYIVYGNSTEWTVDIDGNPINVIDSRRGLAYRSIDQPGYVQWIMQAIQNNHYYIGLVSIDVYNEGILRKSDVDHWVVINGISDQWDFNNMWSEKNWIRITNPFYHRDEYYWWPEFRMAIHPGPALEVWATN